MSIQKTKQVFTVLMSGQTFNFSEEEMEDLVARCLSETHKDGSTAIAGIYDELCRFATEEALALRDYKIAAVKEKTLQTEECAKE